MSELAFLYLIWSALQDGGGPAPHPAPAAPGSETASMIAGVIMGLLVAWAFRREVCRIGALLGTRFGERTGDWIVRRRA